MSVERQVARMPCDATPTQTRDTAEPHRLLFPYPTTRCEWTPGDTPHAAEGVVSQGITVQTLDTSMITRSLPLDSQSSDLP